MGRWVSENFHLLINELWCSLVDILGQLQYIKQLPKSVRKWVSLGYFSIVYLQLMNGNMYKSIATSEMDDNSPSQGNHALGNGNMNGTLQKLHDPDGSEIYKPQPVYDNTIQTRKLPDLPNTPESLGTFPFVTLRLFFGIHRIQRNFNRKVQKLRWHLNCLVTYSRWTKFIIQTDDTVVVYLITISK